MTNNAISPTPPKRLKAPVRISGACEQHVYGTDLDKVTTSAIAKLTMWEPGQASLYPQGIDFYEHVRTISGNRAQWKLIKTLCYSDIGIERLAWHIHKLQLAAKETK